MISNDEFTFILEDADAITQHTAILITDHDNGTYHVKFIKAIDLRTGMDCDLCTISRFKMFIENIV